MSSQQELTGGSCRILLTPFDISWHHVNQGVESTLEWIEDDETDEDGFRDSFSRQLHATRDSSKQKGQIVCPNIEEGLVGHSARTSSIHLLAWHALVAIKFLFLSEDLAVDCKDSHRNDQEVEPRPCVQENPTEYPAIVASLTWHIVILVTSTWKPADPTVKACWIVQR